MATDYISKQKAIETLRLFKPHSHGYDYNPGIEYAKSRIEVLPAANVVDKALFNALEWERDTLLKQVSDLGLGFGERVEPEEFVRRKNILKYLRGLRSRLDKRQKDYFTRDEMLLNLIQLVQYGDFE